MRTFTNSFTMVVREIFEKAGLLKLIFENIAVLVVFDTLFSMAGFLKLAIPQRRASPQYVYNPPHLC